MRRPFVTRHDYTLDHHTADEVPVNQSLHALVFHHAPHSRHTCTCVRCKCQRAVVHTVKEFLQVNIDHPVVPCFKVSVRRFNGLVRVPLRAKPLTVCRKLRVKQRGQHLCDRLFAARETIQNCRYPQQSHAPVRFRDFNPPYRLRTVSPGVEGGPYFQPVRFQVRTQGLHRQPIHAPRTPVGLDPRSRCK